MKNLLINQEPDNGSVSGRLNIVNVEISHTIEYDADIDDNTGYFSVNASYPNVPAQAGCIVLDSFIDLVELRDALNQYVEQYRKAKITLDYENS